MLLKRLHKQTLQVNKVVSTIIGELFICSDDSLNGCKIVNLKTRKDNELKEKFNVLANALFC